MSAVVLNVLFATACCLLALALFFRGRWVLPLAVLGIGALWLLYSPSTLDWIRHLGSDSFSEAQKFDLVEAMNYLQSLDQVIRRQSLRSTALLLAAGLLLAMLACDLAFPALRRRGIDASRALAATGLVLMTGIMALELQPALGAFRSNSEIYGAIRDNFHGHPVAPVLRVHAPPDITAVVYIGESISAANMSLYGYPRATTPALERFADERDNVFVFHEVFAPHVHTAPSLLEALSIGIEAAEDWLPIGERRRVSVVDVLRQAEVPSLLFSNQGSSGAWNNLASTVVFRNVRQAAFSFDSKWLGELEYRVRRPLDHEFLLPALGRLRAGRAGGEVVFLHSYAGHGPYARHIDQRFHEPVDGFLRGMPAEAIVGDGLSDPAQVVATIEDYDSTVRYVDHVVASAMLTVEGWQEPAAFVFFADHGDAVYAGRLHDSSRFLHEMARVPFIIYFNDAFAGRHPGVIDRFRRAASRRAPASLAQFPATLVSLFGLQVQGSHLEGVGEGRADAMPPILTRETSDGYTFVRPGPGVAPTKVTAKDATDFHTMLYRFTRAGGDERPQVCHHRSNTIAAIVRGALVADCLWLDVAMNRDGALAVEPTAALPAGLDLDAALRAAASYGRSLWIDAGRLAALADCDVLGSALAPGDGPPGSRGLIALEFDGRWPDREIRACIGRLAARGFEVAMEVSGEGLQRCDREGAAADADADAGAGGCPVLRALVAETQQGGVIGGIAFDYRLLDTAERLAAGSGLRLNAWNVPPAVLQSGSASRFDRIAVATPPGPNDR